MQTALDWVRRYQIIQPQFSWSYAFEACYSDDEKARMRAAGFAQYLDSASAWLAKVPESVRKQGAKWWEENNPFIIPEERLEKSSTSI
jgi:hypothetical protein